jgi:hypothetical protein
MPERGDGRCAAELAAAKEGQKGRGGMSDRSLIFNAKGAQIGYIEADRAFDLTERERCKSARTTGNLFELNSEKIVGYVSLDGAFVGLSLDI